MCFYHKEAEVPPRLCCYALATNVWYWRGFWYEIPSTDVGSAGTRPIWTMTQTMGSALPLPSACLGAWP